MAKQIIVLETNPADGGRNSIKYVAWFAVPVNKQVPQPAVANSQWSGASQAEIDAIRSGAVLEEVRTISVPASYSTTELKAVLQKDYTDRLNYLANQPFKLQYNGVFFDSVSGWSA
jgi:hypothetical protein